MDKSSFNHWSRTRCSKAIRARYCYNMLMQFYMLNETRSQCVTPIMLQCGRQTMSFDCQTIISSRNSKHLVLSLPGVYTFADLKLVSVGRTTNRQEAYPSGSSEPCSLYPFRLPRNHFLPFRRGLNGIYRRSRVGRLVLLNRNH